MSRPAPPARAGSREAETGTRGQIPDAPAERDANIGAGGGSATLANELLDFVKALARDFARVDAAIERDRVAFAVRTEDACPAASTGRLVEEAAVP